ncbi:hypothetical protein A2U01_0042693 [Trifolium medium]|uniref:Uncharacterized protein n=1 Tax=Trifolium medium TaxID=97028 RepID=A0A392QE25_9FABA|nr:hypothetical protein [Trifolium medium]
MTLGPGPCVEEDFETFPVTSLFARRDSWLARKRGMARVCEDMLVIACSYFRKLLEMITRRISQNVACFLRARYEENFAKCCVFSASACP